MYVHVCMGACGYEKWPAYLVLEVQEVVSHITWVLGNKLRLSLRGASALHHGATAPATSVYILCIFLYFAMHCPLVQIADDCIKMLRICLFAFLRSILNNESQIQIHVQLHAYFHIIIYKMTPEL